MATCNVLARWISKKGFTVTVLFLLVALGALGFGDPGAHTVRHLSQSSKSLGSPRQHVASDRDEKQIVFRIPSP